MRAHPRQRLEHLLADRWLVPGEGDQLGDVHALVAHPLDVLDHVQQSRDQAQVPRYRRLQREQREDPLVDLQVAAVDAVVVGDHHLRELDVLVLERLQHPVELLDYQIKTPQGMGFQILQLPLKVRPSLADTIGGRPLAGGGNHRRGPQFPALGTSRTCR